MSHLSVLLRIAARNLFGSFLNVIVGLIILGGTFFFVVGSTLLSNIDNAMSRSIIGSVSGHAQVYSSKSKDELSLFNNWGAPDIAAIPDFAKVKASAETVENVKAVIPMGINGAFLAHGNSMDVALEKLRDQVNKHDSSSAGKMITESLKGHVRQMITVIQGGFKNLAAIANGNAVDAESKTDLDRAAADEFWNGFDRDPLNHLEFLENKISSLVPDADFVYLSYIGTDLDAYAKSFDRLKIVDGTAVPSGQRGMLLSKIAYEDQFKLKIARRLDKINEAIGESGKKIKSDSDLSEYVKQNKNQVQEIALQLDSIATHTLTGKLQMFLNSKEAELPKLLATFLDTDDANFKERYTWFYSDIAPLVELYRLKPGEMLTVKGYTKTGFVQSVNVKVYGTYQFKGLERSELAGGWSLMDLMSFRDLYGYMTPDKLKEMKELEKSAGVKMIARDNAEAELFGGATTVVENAQSKKIQDTVEIGDTKHMIKTASLVDRKYTNAEIESGVALNAALILKDPAKLKQTMTQIEEAMKRDALDIRVVNWQKAAGSLGQFVFVSKIVLYVAVFIIFIVALVVINNAVMMATLQRIREIGTMRAIGAQRSFVLSLVLVETLVLGAVFGGLGILLGSGLIQWLGHKGIPASNQALYFFFSGPRLFPTLGVGSIFGAAFIVMVVTTLSALYPAIIATRVSPIQAMSNED